ncbi:MAG: energy-coupling factor transporter ATPase [Oscillospiraceae bacterium]|jgi:energy-coupling factor transport system ATP-binding protein|nr:energy-coupling factor transporter ATPase [Oscillospiraceae bacterium]
MQGRKKQNMIELKNVHFSYESATKDTKLALNRINLKISCGEFVAVVGANGSGKSTLAKHLNGLLIPTSGDVLVLGANTKCEEDSIFIKKNVGMVFQNPDNQLVFTIVEEDVAFALENLGVPQQEMRERVEKTLSQLNILEYKNASNAELSGGQKQLVAIAGVLVINPKFIVLDESTAMLDPQSRDDVMCILKKLNSELGIAVVLITHFMEEAALAERIIVMNEGKVELDDSPRQVFKKLELLESIGLSVPQVTKFCHELNLLGENLPLGIVDENECAIELAKILKGPRR